MRLKNTGKKNLVLEEFPAEDSASFRPFIPSFCKLIPNNKVGINGTVNGILFA